MWAATPLPLHEALSGIFGSISLASWVFLLVRSLLSMRASSADSNRFPSL